MDLLHVFQNELPSLLTWNNILWMFLGIAVGMIFGLLPGLGSPQALALFLPVTIGLGPVEAMIFFLAISAGADAGGGVTSILLGVPGTPANAATIFDGYELTKKGKAGLALGACAGANIIGGLFGVLTLMLILQFGYRAVLSFSYPELFMLAMLGIILIASESEGAFLKALIAGGLGLLLSTVGYDLFLSHTRYTFGIFYLWDGIKIVPVLIGLFALVESVEFFVRGAQSKQGEVVLFSLSGVGEGFLAAFRNWMTALIGSTIGVIIGILPGVGASLAQFMAYNVASQAAGEGSEFGHGDVRGVIAPESSNNSKMGGALVPTFLFGIPGSVETAIILGAFMIHGITPGLTMVTSSPGVLVGSIVGLTISTLISAIFIVSMARYCLRIILIPPTIVGAIVFALSILGAYASDNNYGDVVLALTTGMLGFLMKRHGFSRICLIIGLLLGKIAEMNLRQGMATMGLGGFFTRPITLFLLMIVILALAYVSFVQIKKGRATAKTGVGTP